MDHSACNALCHYLSVGIYILEDSGILPRIAVLSDSLMSKIGIQGGSLINIMLGFGCTVPAIIGTRTASTKKERLVVTAALCFSIPCISQIGALITLVGDYSYFMLLLLVLVGLLMFVISSLVTGKLVSGTVSPMIMEIHICFPRREVPLQESSWSE